MNLQDSKASLICVVFLFIQSTLSGAFETGRETDYNLYNYHPVIETPFECDCHWEDIRLPEVSFYSPNFEIPPLPHKHGLEQRNEYVDSFLEKHEENNNNADSDNSDNRQVDSDLKLGQPQLSENSDNDKLPELTARSKPHLNKMSFDVGNSEYSPPLTENNQKPRLTFAEFRATIDKRSHARGYLQSKDE